MCPLVASRHHCRSWRRFLNQQLVDPKIDALHPHRRQAMGFRARPLHDLLALLPPALSWTSCHPPQCPAQLGSTRRPPLRGELQDPALQILLPFLRLKHRSPEVFSRSNPQGLERSPPRCWGSGTQNRLAEVSLCPAVDDADTEKLVWPHSHSAGEAGAMWPLRPYTHVKGYLRCISHPDL